MQEPGSNLDTDANGDRDSMSEEQENKILPKDFFQFEV